MSGVHGAGVWSRIGDIRRRLIGLTVLAALPVTAMAVVIAAQNYDQIARGAQERAILLDGQALAQFHVAIASVQRHLVLASAALASGGCGAIAPSTDYGMVTIDVDGRTACRVGTVPAEPPSPSPWLEQVRGGQPIGLGQYGPGGWPVVAVPGAATATVAAILPPSWLASDILPDAVQPGDAYWLLDATRSVLTSTGDAADALPTGATLVRLESANQMALRARAAQGSRYAYASTALPGGWRLIAATSAERENATALQATLAHVFEFACLLLAGSASVVIGADIAFGTPLRRLNAAVRRWQAGAAFDAGDLRGAPDEVSQLAASFTEATGVLQKRGEQLARAKQQQDLLVMEVHHRVKNNLQVVASLLNLQASRIRAPEARAEFQAARDRVRALATLHRHLYADGDLHTIKMRPFLTELCGQLFQAMGETAGDRIQMVIEAPELRLSSDQAVPLALIVTEAVTNSVRYAFPHGRRGRVDVTLTEHDGVVDLLISDDGVGIEAVRPGPDTRDGIGLQLIHGFSRQLGATLSIDETDGTRYAVRLTPPRSTLDTGVADASFAA